MSNTKVYIIGAGPGDCGLITVKGMEKLKIADVILFDKLANPGLLDYAKPNAEIIFVGKEAGLHHVSQDDTIKLLIKKAEEGKIVARLKGGDPFIFGRGSEEAQALKESDIDYEIIPGITAAIGASAYSGIPLTHRNLVTQCVFITAHESQDKDDSQVDWLQLARLKNTTLVLYMGASTLPKTVKELIKGGMNPEKPAAIIENATLAQQRIIIDSLINMPERIIQDNIKPPVIVIIGDTVLFHKDLDWLSSKPLFGKRIVTTRAKDQFQSLFNLLKDEGAIPIPFHTIRTEVIKPDNSLDELFKQNKFDWLIFSSENGVKYFFNNLRKENLDARILNSAKIAVIGSGTARILESFGLIADFIPKKFTSESLTEELPLYYNLKNAKILRIKGDFNNDPLSEGIIKCGATVDTLNVYKIIKETPDEKIINDLTDNPPDAFTFTSSSTVNFFFEILGNESAKTLLNKSKVVSIGPVTTNTLISFGVINIITAEEHTIKGIMDGLNKIFVQFLSLSE
jgi:uroporphyrinogen III methyltransferase / synthase